MTALPDILGNTKMLLREWCVSYTKHLAQTSTQTYLTPKMPLLSYFSQSSRFKSFRKKQAPFDKEYRWNSAMTLKGESYRWHEEYSLPYTIVLGFVAARVCSKLLGIGPCERSWGDVKNIKTGKRAHLSGDSTEKRAIVYSTALMDTARLRRKEMEKVDGNKSNMFGDDDMK